MELKPGLRRADFGRGSAALAQSRRHFRRSRRDGGPVPGGVVLTCGSVGAQYGVFREIP